MFYSYFAGSYNICTQSFIVMLHINCIIPTLCFPDQIKNELVARNGCLVNVSTQQKIRYAIILLNTPLRSKLLNELLAPRLILTESTMELNVREAIAFTNSDMHHLIVRCNQKSDSIQFIESFALLLKTHFICVLISCYLVTKAVVVTDCAAFWGTLIFKGSQATEAVSYIMAAAAITTVLCSRINITGNCSLDVNT